MRVKYLFPGLILLVCATTLIPGVFSGTEAHAQSAGAICVTAYRDADQNGVRAEGDELLPDVNVSLMVDSNVMVANYVTDGQGPYCFENLPAGEYIVSIDSPLFEAVSSGPVSVKLESGQRIERELAAVSRVLDDGSSYVPLTVPVRLRLSVLAALGAMFLFSGLGFLIYGLFFHRRPKVAEMTSATIPGIAVTLNKGKKGSPVIGMQMRSAKGRRASKAARTADVLEPPVSDKWIYTPPDATGDQPLKKSQIPVEDFDDEFGDSFDDEFGDKK